MRHRTFGVWVSYRRLFWAGKRKEKSHSHWKIWDTGMKKSWKEAYIENGPFQSVKTKMSKNIPNADAGFDACK